MNPELSPEELGLSEKDKKLTRINFNEKESFWQKISRSKKLILPVIAIATLSSGAESEASENKLARYLAIKNQFKTNMAKNIAAKLAPDYVETQDDGSARIPEDVLSASIGDLVIHGQRITLKKDWGRELAENKASFEKEIDKMAKTNPSLADALKGHFKSLYAKMFPKGLTGKSQIEVDRAEEGEDTEKVNVSTASANTLQISEYMTEQTKPLFTTLEKLPDDKRLEMTKTIQKEEIEIVELATLQECEEN